MMMMMINHNNFHWNLKQFN